MNKIFRFTFREYDDIDVNAVYHQLVATYTSDSDDHQQPGTSTGSITPAGRRRFVYHMKYVVYGVFSIKISVTVSDLEETQHSTAQEAAVAEIGAKNVVNSWI